MRADIGGIVLAFAVFHAPNGDLVAVDPADGQLIVRPADAQQFGTDVRGRTIIQTGAGNALVVESPEEVMRQLEKAKEKSK